MYQFTGKIGYFYKFNANCKQEEKQGEGPGSCGGQKDTLITKQSVNFEEVSKVNGKYVVIVRSDRDLTKFFGFPFSSSSGDYYKKKFPDKKSAERYRTRMMEIVGNSTSIPKSESVPNTPSSKSEPTNISQSKKESIVSVSPIGDGSRQKLTYKGSISHSIIVPSGSERSGNSLHNKLIRLPIKLSKSVTNFRITNRASVDDAKMSKNYGYEFSSEASYDNTTRTIIFHGRDGMIPPIKDFILVHELTHAMDAKSIISSSDEYKDAVNKDSQLSKKSAFTSNYAKEAHQMYKSSGNYKDIYSEDFADGVAKYLKDAESFEKQFPNRASLYKKYLSN